MPIVLLHTGQSGVERGADRAARLLGIPIEGVCSTEGRDELGTLPTEILADLTRCPTSGSRNALRATLERADALVIGVPDVRLATEATGVDPLRRKARASGVPVWLVDPTTNLDTLAKQVHGVVTASPLRLMITGPRRTRWLEGDRLGGRVVAEMSSHVRRTHRVLVLDDERDTAEAARDLVRALGHVCVTASNGAEAMRLASEFKPDVALLDLQLPDITGYDVARHMRERGTAPLFLAAITGWDMDSTKSLDAGFDRHVVKPATAPVIERLMSEASAALAV